MQDIQYNILFLEWKG